MPTVDGSLVVAAALSDSTPAALGVAAAGVGTAASRDDHVHAAQYVSVGPFYVTTAADQTAVGTKLGDTAGMAWVAPAAGSVMGVSGMIDAAVTGAGKSIKVRVYKAVAAAPTVFTLLNAALDLDFTQAGAELADRATAAVGTYTFAAGDLLKLVYTTDTITNTPKFVGALHVKC